MRPPYLVIGIGNTLRGDDGAGSAVIDALRDRVDTDHVELTTCHQLLPECVETLRGRRGIVFVDASVEIAAGAVHDEQVEIDPMPWRWGHQLRPSTLLNMIGPSERPPARIVEIGATFFEYGITFSPAVSTAIGVARDTVLRELEELDRIRSASN